MKSKATLIEGKPQKRKKPANAVVSTFTGSHVVFKNNSK